MERLEKERGLSSRKLLLLGFLLVLSGNLGASVLQRGLLGIGRLSGLQLLENMQTSGSAMTTATIALVLQAAETCAVPIFGWLLTQAMIRDRFPSSRAVALTVLAAASEPCYDLAMFGEALVFSEQNPLWGLVIAWVLLYFFRRYGGKTGSGTAVRVLVAVAAILWCNMLQVKNGTFLQILVLTFWLLQNKPMAGNFTAAGLSVVCSVLSPFYLAAPMGVLLLHFHRETEEEETVSVWAGLAYPGMLLLCAGAAWLLSQG